jgi:hypothetical protein
LKLSTEIRGALFRAGCALLVAGACLPAAAAQSLTGDPAAKTAPNATTVATQHPKTPASTLAGTTKSGRAKSGTTKSGSAKSSTTKSSAATSAFKKPSRKTHTASTGKLSSRKKPVRARGQQKIDSERAQAIQDALIREHYLSGQATGTWNQSSEEAMRRYQADHGWQSKEVPDSRALIKLGLGPSKDHLLNPESAMTTVPDPPRAEPMPTGSHSAAQGTDPVSVPNQRDSSHPQ